jgi:hypothetical protein
MVQEEDCGQKKARDTLTTPWVLKLRGGRYSTYSYSKAWEALAAVNITLQALTVRSPGPAMLNTIREQTLRKNLGRVVQEGIEKGALDLW